MLQDNYSGGLLEFIPSGIHYGQYDKNYEFWALTFSGNPN